MKVKVVATLLALTLCVGLMPLTALAETASAPRSQPLAMQSADLSAQSVKPRDAKSAPRSIYKLYKPAIKKAASATGPFKDYKSMLNSGYEARYALYDMNSDGVPELVFHAGVYMAGGQNCYVYTVKGGKLKYCGYTNAGFGGVAGGPKCLYISQAHTGYVGYWTVKLSGAKLVRETAYEGTYADPDGSGAAFLKRAGMKALTWSDCASYSLLKKKANLSSGKVFDAAVTVQASAAYTGKAIKPKVTVKYLGSALTAGKDYTVSYRNATGKKVSAPKAAGTYKVTVTGKGAYKGSATKSFKVTGRITNAQAKKAYASVVKKLSGDNYIVNYKYADVVGDSTVELVVIAYPNEGQWSVTRIFTMKSGKAKSLMNRRGYGGWNSMSAYKKSSSLVFSGSGHGGDTRLYMKLASGGYKEKAIKSRPWGGSWSYSVPQGSTYKTVSKAAFDKKVGTLQKGKAKKVAFKGMKTVANEAKR